MTQIISLFHDPEAMESALDILNKAGLDLEVNVVEPGVRLNTLAMPPLSPVFSQESASRPGVGAWAVVAMDDIKGLDEEESAFLQRHLEDGGMAMVIGLEDDDDQSFVQQVLEEHEGRVAVKS